MEKKKLLVIDSNALLHRAFHALPPLTTKNGEQTGAVYGFLLVLFKAIKDLNPGYIVACFDVGAPTFRHEQFAGYKAKRVKTPDELISQIPKIKEVLTAFEVPVFGKAGFEADDLIATIVQKVSKNKDIETYILTGDLDMLQLVNNKVKVYTLGRGVKETITYDEAAVASRFGITPEQVIDFKSLAGDPSDNIPGAPGIGKKTAAELLQKFKTLDNIYKQMDKGSADIKDRVKEILLNNKEQVLFSKSLVDAKKDVDIDFKLGDSKFGSYNKKKAEGVLLKFQFNTLVKKISEINSDTPKLIQKSLIL
ncbi:MAG: 5'-3' exonuclease H3TH domain-containing protein [Candidatus Staskawiczbacteria bacterium]|jgi:DNA polymerase-1